MEKDLNKRRCVIADDVRSSREMLKRWMCELFFEVTTGANGAEAWEHLKHTPCDLLITDLEMPGMSGLELVRRLRRDGDPKHKLLPVMIITSLSDQQMGDLARDFTVATVVIKPLDKKTILTVAERLMHGESVRNVYESSQTSSGGMTGISPALRNLIDQAK